MSHQACETKEADYTFSKSSGDIVTPVGVRCSPFSSSWFVVEYGMCWLAILLGSLLLDTDRRTTGESECEKKVETDSEHSAVLPGSALF